MTISGTKRKPASTWSLLPLANNNDVTTLLGNVLFAST